MLSKPSVSTLWLAFSLACCASLTFAACGDPSTATTNATKPSVLNLNVDFDQRLVLPTSTLTFKFKGTDSLVITRAQLELDGQLGASAFSWAYEATGGDELKLDGQAATLTRTRGDVGDLVMSVPVSAGLWAAIGAQKNRFDGALRLSLFDPFGQLVATSTLEAISLDFDPDATPTVTSIDLSQAYLDERISVEGTKILRPEEGQTWAVIEQGKMSYPNGTSRQLQDVRVPIRWAGRRDRGELVIDPTVFGVKPGSFEGDVAVVNTLADGTALTGNRQQGLTFSLEPSFISVPEPLAGARGQRITLKGRGLVQTRDDVYMTLIFSGRFTPDDARFPAQDFTGANALERTPDRYLDDQGVEVAVWYEVINEGGKTRLTGLGAVPGTFSGSITPRFYDSFGNTEAGFAWSGDFKVLPTKQVVYLKYLPRFSQALDRYGLRNVERELRDKILSVAQLPYDEVNVQFTETPPTDFIDYATLELSGPDPYGRKAFGYDNSFNGVAKDVDNLFLADYIGGWNQGSKDAFDNPFGGVYIESFDYFSLKISGQRTDGSTNDDATADFDEILGPFMPELGGSPVKATEWPDGPRAEQISRAIHMVGNVVGNTVAHEVGHSMGLSFYETDREKPGDAFHNKLPGEGFLMDSGSDRPFNERANIKGFPAARFNERNINYLKEILPKAQ